MQCCLEYLGQHYTRFLPVLCWPMSNRQFYEENNLYSFVSTLLRQYSIGILSSQCCPNTSETILHKKITCAMLDQSTQTCFRRKITYTIFSRSACANIVQENYLCIVYPHPRVTLHRKTICNVVLIYEGQHCARKLPAECCPMVNRQLFLEK